MFVFNTADPFNCIMLLAATILLIFLGKETKQSLIPQVVLLVYLLLIVIHAIQLATVEPQYLDTIKMISQSLAVDFGLILISFFAYLWVDDIEAKVKKKKSIDDSLDWFWKKV